MQSIITWGQLFTAAVIILLFYYGVVFFLFYRHEFRFSTSFIKKRGNSLAPYASLNDSTRSVQNAGDVLYNSVLELMEDCKPVFKEAAAGDQMDKEYLLDCIRLRVQKYPQIKGTAFQLAMTNHITQELDNRLGTTLTDSEIESIWR